MTQHMWAIAAVDGDKEIPVATATSEQDAMVWIRQDNPELRIYRPRPADPDYIVFRTRGAEWVARYSARRVPVVPPLRSNRLG
jgi:hypothetical protein